MLEWFTSWPAAAALAGATLTAHWDRLKESEIEPYLVGAGYALAAFITAFNLTKNLATQRRVLFRSAAVIAVVALYSVSQWSLRSDQYSVTVQTSIAANSKAGVPFFTLLQYESNSPVAYPIHQVCYLNITSLKKAPATVVSYFFETEITPGKWVEIPSVNVGLGKVVLSVNPYKAMGLILENPTLNSVLHKHTIEPGHFVEGLVFWEIPDEGFGGRYRMTITDSVGNTSSQVVKMPGPPPYHGHEVGNFGMMTTDEDFDLSKIPFIYFSDRYGVNSVPKVKK